jgi:hypothetical protein
LDDPSIGPGGKNLPIESYSKAIHFFTWVGQVILGHISILLLWGKLNLAISLGYLYLQALVG